MWAPFSCSAVSLGGLLLSGVPGVLRVLLRLHVIVSADRASCAPGALMLHGALQAAQISTCTVLRASHCGIAGTL